LFPSTGEDSSTLLKNADAAMYRAKESGGNTYQFYSADMGAHAERRLTLENDLRLALERGEFVLHYQPQIASGSGKIIGCEALLRWQHPQQGLIPPLEFISILEETGLIVPVGRWVLEIACAQLAIWRQRGQRNFTMAVNVASRQFHEPGLAELVTELLQRHSLEPQHLELEITEGTLMQHVPSTADTLAALAQLGVRIALDDFGTGYSSLSYLRRFPIDTLKIDRAFIRDIPGDADDTAITRAIIALAQSLHLRIVAEGVETEEQRRFLNGFGCESMQGYLFGKPVPAEEFDRLL
ncbi:MAG: EAL domain-containing protein, partial [Gammaproteobacteria bacterium]|nr:EAL domain-containing protein [Gammaproteobacteria bacterium]